MRGCAADGSPAPRHWCSGCCHCWSAVGPAERTASSGEPAAVCCRQAPREKALGENERKKDGGERGGERERDGDQNYKSNDVAGSDGKDRKKNHVAAHDLCPDSIQRNIHT